MRQMEIDSEKNSAALDLNHFFYPLHVLQQAAAEFKEVASVSVSQKGARVLVTIEPKGKEKAGETALHFCNFALGLKRELGDHA